MKQIPKKGDKVSLSIKKGKEYITLGVGVLNFNGISLLAKLLGSKYRTITLNRRPYRIKFGVKYKLELYDN